MKKYKIIENSEMTPRRVAIKKISKNLAFKFKTKWTNFRLYVFPAYYISILSFCYIIWTRMSPRLSWGSLWTLRSWSSDGSRVAEWREIPRETNLQHGGVSVSLRDTHDLTPTRSVPGQRYYLLLRSCDFARGKMICDRKQLSDYCLISPPINCCWSKCIIL